MKKAVVVFSICLILSRHQELFGKPKVKILSQSRSVFISDLNFPLMPVFNSSHPNIKYVPTNHYITILKIENLKTRHTKGSKGIKQVRLWLTV